MGYLVTTTKTEGLGGRKMVISGFQKCSILEGWWWNENFTFVRDVMHEEKGGGMQNVLKAL